MARKSKLWPIRARRFTPRQLTEIGSDIVSYLDGVGEDDDINGGDLVERVVLALQNSQGVS